MVYVLVGKYEARGEEGIMHRSKKAVEYLEDTLQVNCFLCVHEEFLGRRHSSEIRRAHG